MKFFFVSWGCHDRELLSGACKNSKIITSASVGAIAAAAHAMQDILKISIEIVPKRRYRQPKKAIR